jgi:hypothetical protein
MASRRIFVLLLVMLAAGVAPAKSQVDGDPENWCRAGGFTRYEGELRIGTAKGNRSGRISFYNDFKPECPAESCRESSYIVPGDKVVVTGEYKGFVCSWYTPARGGPTIGWIRSSDLSLSTPARTVSFTSWIGQWTYADNTVSFTNNKLRGWLNVTGEAFWRGLGDNIHIGEVDDRVEPKRNVVLVGARETDEYACKVSIKMVGPFLVVHDNMKCGGANVTFSGVYRRKR